MTADSGVPGACRGGAAGRGLAAPDDPPPLTGCGACLSPDTPVESRGLAGGRSLKIVLWHERQSVPFTFQL